MIEELVYKIINNKVKQLDKSNYNNDTLHITMMTHIHKYLGEIKADYGNKVNLIKPTEQDMIMYLVYLLYNQKLNDIEALNNIQKIIDFKIDVHKNNINKQDIDNIIDLYKTQIKLK